MRRRYYILVLLLLMMACGKMPRVVPVQGTFPDLRMIPEPNGIRPLLTQEEDKSISNNTGSLRVLSLNTWALPRFLGTDRKSRMAAIAGAISGYDIVTLQETFSKDAGVIGENSEFPYQKWHREKNWHIQTSGLFVLSRFPITESDFQEFKNCTLTDCFSRKGVLFTRIQHPSLGPVNIFTTHYQSGDMPVAANVRKEEDNKVIMTLVRQKNQGYPTILTGDFNFLPKEMEYQDLSQRLPLLDTFMTLNPNVTGYTYDSTRNSYAEGPSQRLDYIFVLKNPAYSFQVQHSAITFDQPINGQMASDHFGIESTIGFSLGR